MRVVIVKATSIDIEVIIVNLVNLVNRMNRMNHTDPIDHTDLITLLRKAVRLVNGR